MATQRIRKNVDTVPAQLVIDHIQPNFGLRTVNFHCLRVDADGNRTGGFDIDQVTGEELGIPADAEFLTSLTNNMVTEFVSALEGIPAVLDAPQAKEGDPAPIEVAPLPQVTIGGDTPATT